MVYSNFYFPRNHTPITLKPRYSSTTLNFPGKTRSRHSQTPQDDRCRRSRFQHTALVKTRHCRRKEEEEEARTTRRDHLAARQQHEAEYTDSLQLCYCQCETSTEDKGHVE